jgi:quercetin dioxygenase-like cupin family protein
MKNYNLDEMFKGWFVGNFSPSVAKTNNCEVAVKRYSKGDYEPAHYHKIATEITLILEGKVRMAGREWSAGDIIEIEPGEITDFEALTDVRNVVVKIPGVENDKYIADNQNNSIG